MWTALVTLVPVGLALGLLAFGRYGERRPPAPTARSVAPVAAAALVLGPLAVAALGFFIWLVCVVIVAAAILMFAMLRTPPLRH
ncbi:MAG: hypothetical protein QOE86_195 [Solirubrobacteraceae bacterium]|jgi:hypothetical protein|nr:hypothetical protein [Solirubrobacteraceae bacterium]